MQVQVLDLEITFATANSVALDADCLTRVTAQLSDADAQLLLATGRTPVAREADHVHQRTVVEREQRTSMARGKDTGGDPTGNAYSEGYIKGMEFCSTMLAT